MGNKKRNLILLGILLSVIILGGAAWYLSNKDEKSIPSSNIDIKLTKKSAKDIKQVSDRNYYYMEIGFDNKGKKLEGYEVVKFNNKYTEELKELVFHLYPDAYNSSGTMTAIGQNSNTRTLKDEEKGDIEIKSVIVNGVKQQFTQDNQALKINLDKKVGKGEARDITIEFELKIPKGNDRLGYGDGLEQFSLTNWYPILAIYNDKEKKWDDRPFYPIGESNYSDCSDYEVVVTTPKEMVLVATGINNEEKIDGNKKIYKFTESNVRDFVFFGSTSYKVVSKEVDGVKINSYYLKNESTAKRMLNIAADSLVFYSKTFGAYPYKEFDIVESYLAGGAMEYPTVIQMGLYRALPENFDPKRTNFLDEAVAHETAHQWWYSTVGNNEFEEPILDEAFTAYSTALFFEKKYGENNSLGVKAAFLKTDDYSKDLLPIYRPSDKLDWRTWGITVYKLGPVVLEDFRRMVGEENFLEVFRTYYDRFKFKNATLDGFLKVVEEKCGKDKSDYLRDAFTSKDYNYDKYKLNNEEIEMIRKANGS